MQSLQRIAAMLSWLAAMSAGTASAQACGEQGRPWVAVVFTGAAWTDALRAAVLLDLRAGLRLESIETCEGVEQGSETSLARLDLRAADADHISVGIEVHDAVTAKRVSREVDLRALSADARALAIASATDELLRASWTELALKDAPVPARPAPRAVERAVRRSLEPARVGSREHAIGVRGAVELHAAGLTLLGADLYLDLWLSERLGVELGVGLREGVRRAAPHGSVDARALGSALGMLFAMLPREQPFGLYGRVMLAVSSLRMQGIAGERSVIGAEGAAVDVHGRAGFAASFAPWPGFALRVETELGVPLRGVRATDSGRAVASSGGLQLHAGLGTEVRF
jgi:hypothetical protein